MSQVENWTPVCALEDLVTNSGVCALINDEQVAIFKVGASESAQYFAISNWDPIGKAFVLYRGLIGSVGDDVVVASPLYKQRFSLVTGQCYDAEIEPLTVYPVNVKNQTLHIAA